MSYMKQRKKCKETLKSVKYRLQIIFKGLPQSSSVSLTGLAEKMIYKQ